MGTKKNIKPLRVGILGSGKGSNLQSIIDAAENGNIDVEISCVISDTENAYILERAVKHGIPAKFISAAPFKTKLEGDAEQEYISFLKEHNTDAVALAGFMRIVKRPFLTAFPNKIINIHPALLPAFPGVASWEQALEYGAKVAGCTVHLVDEGTDTGPIILQKCVPIETGDTSKSLHARIQAQEHIAYPEALQLIAENKLTVDGRKVIIA